MRPSPALLLAVAALGIATSSIFLDLSGTSPSTATFFRCAMAVPLLVPLAVRERRRGGVGRPLTRRQVAYAAVAGAFFAGDSLWWTQAIGEVGAGLSTVLVNAQVVLVPLLALAVDREPISRRFVAALPVMLAGIVLTGGVFESGAGGADPVGGTVHALLAAACYSGFLFLLRRGGGEGQVVRNYLVVVVAAAVVALAVGPFWGEFTLRPTLGQLGWLVLITLVGQVVGWLLIAFASPRLRSEVGAALLLLTPVGALALAAVVLGERPSGLQLVGCALVLISAYVASVRRPVRRRAPRRRRPPTAAPGTSRRSSPPPR